MKKLSKVLALVLAFALVLGLGATAMAADAPSKGTITITNATKNQVYKAYKIFNAYVDATDTSKVNYTVSAANKALLDDASPFNVGNVASDGGYNVTVKEGKSDSDILQWINTNATSFDTGTTGTFNAAGSVVTFSNMDFGYYFITSGLGAAVTIDTLGPTVEFQDKNLNKPTDPVKEITAIDGQKTDLESAQVGSIVSFKASFDAVNWVVEDGISEPLSVDSVTPVPQTQYVIVDTPTNMTILNSTDNPIKITVGGTEITNFTFADNTFTIPWATGLNSGAWVDGTSQFIYAPVEGESTIPVVIEYDAKITATAADAGANNAIGDSITSVELYKFQLDKVDGSYAALTGAKFQLKDSSGTLIKFSMDGDDYVADLDGTIEEIDLSSTASAVIKGLKKAEYTLHETQTPGGYNDADDQTVADSVLLTHSGTIVDETGVDNDEGVVTVINEQGLELPSTGGIGTTLFYIVGAVLVIGAGVLLVTRKRMTAQ